MPDDPCASSAFIWYYAEASMAGELQSWVRSMGKELGVSCRLLMRKQPDKTTFMEIYETASSARPETVDMVERIEARAAKQAWFIRLQSPRRAEIFTTLSASET